MHSFSDAPGNPSDETGPGESLAKRVAAKSGATGRRPRTLAIDIGGTRVKATVLDAEGQPMGDPHRALTPRPATPRAVLDAIARIVATLGAYDRISAGFPGVVRDGVVKTAPNLAPSWAGVDLADRLARLLKRPARVLNDAGVQGFGVVEGKGLEMMLTLGTGLGCALFYEGSYIPNLELGHHPFRKGKTYEDYLGAKALARAGVEKWNRRLERALAQIEPVWNPDRIYLGGGNSKRVTLELPANIRIAANVAGMLGGIALWDGREGLELAKATRATTTADPKGRARPPT